MFANVFEVLARELDAYFKSVPPRTLHELSVVPGTPTPTVNETLTPSGSLEPPTDNDPPVEIISFLKQQNQQDFIKFELNKVTPILVNVEEENQLRPADRFARMADNGSREKIWPDVRLNLYVLFVSSFYDYTDALYYLGLIVKYFQAHPILDHDNTPGLSPEIDKLQIEIITLPFSEQNEVWNALRSAYHPSLLYRVKMLVFQDQPDVMSPGMIYKVQTDSSNFP